MKIIYRRILVLTILLLTGNVFGQVTLQGVVADSLTQEPLIGASLYLVGTALGNATNVDGEYKITNIPEGDYQIRISYVGYKTKFIKLSLMGKKTVELFIQIATEQIEGKTITVTAQAEGQLSAINQQLSSNTIANVVSKARIKELPDVNAAESIGRLPGVSIQRYGGEATKVEVRGLNPKFSLITVNGVEFPSTGSTDRSVDLSLVSANMLDGISLKKSVTPDMDADVLGGTIDLKLREASQNLLVNVSAQGGYNALQKYYGNYNISANVSNRFFTNQLGVIFNVNIDNYDRSADKFQDDWFNYGRGGNKPDTIVSGHLSMREEKLNRKRAGASLLIDYLIPNGKITANGFYNQLNSEGLFHIDHFFTTTATYNTNRRYYQLEQFKSSTNVFTSALAIEQDLDWIRYDANLSRSGTTTDDPDHRSWQFNQESGAIQNTLFYPYMAPQDIAAIAYVDTNKAYLSQLYINSTRIVENSTSAKLNITLPFRLGYLINGTFKVGVKLRLIERSNDEGQAGYQGLQYGGGGTTLNPVFRYLDNLHPEWNIKSIVTQNGGLSLTPFLSNYTRSNFLNNEYALGPVPEVTLLNQMTDALHSAPSQLNLWIPNSIGTFGNDYRGFERYKAVYMMGEFHLGDYFILIPGIRYEDEYTSYDGQRYRQVQSGQTAEQPPAEFVNLSSERKNSFWLPMINLIVKPTSWLQFILARTETIARPDFRQYAPISYVDAQSQNITSTNYSLKSSRATNYDMGVTIFNNDIGLLSGSAFYKKIDDLVFYSTFKLLGGVTPDPNLEIPSGWYKGASPQVNTYRNNPNPAKYYGFEVEWQTHFWYLPSVFRGLLLNVNYTHIYSEMELQYDSLRSVISGFPPRTSYSFVQRTIKTRMPDQPSYILNITIGYDYEEFSARISYLFQTDKLTSIGYDGTLPTPRLSTYQGAYGRWDLSLQQKIGKYLQVFVNLNNLNSRKDMNLIGGNEANPTYMEYYGFTMDLGFRYSL